MAAPLAPFGLLLRRHLAGLQGLEQPTCPWKVVVSGLQVIQLRSTEHSTQLHACVHICQEHACRGTWSHLCSSRCRSIAIRVFMFGRQ